MSTRILRYNSTTIAESQDNNMIKQDGFLCQWQRKKNICSLICMDEKICRRENPFYSLSVKVCFDPQFILLRASYLLGKLKSFDLFFNKKKREKKRQKASQHLNLRIFLCCSAYLSYELQQGPSGTALGADVHVNKPALFNSNYLGQAACILQGSKRQG